MKLKLTNLLFFLIIIPSVFAQEIKPVTMVEVLEMAGSKNLRIKEFQQRYELAVADEVQANEWYLPTLQGGLSTHFLAGSAMNGDGRFFTDVRRDNFWGGLGFNASWDFGQGIYGHQAVKARIQGANDAIEAQKNQTLLSVALSYIDLQAAHVKSLTLEKLLLQSDTLIRQIQVQVDGGLEYASDLLLAKANHNHLRIQEMEARENVDRHAATLSELLNIRDNTILMVSDSVIRPTNLVGNEAAREISLYESYSQRPEYAGLENSVSALELERKTTTKALALPTLQVGGSGSMFGAFFTPLYPTAEVNVGLMWNLPLGRLIKRGEVQQFDKRILLQKNLIEQFRDHVSQEIGEAKVSMRGANARMEVAIESMEFAKKALDQSMQRQRLRTARPYEVFQAQEYYIEAQLDFIKAVSEYNKAQYRLFVASGNML